MSKRVCGAAVAVWMGAVAAHAGDLVYTPVNPSFGGSPLNSAHLLATASAQREETASDFREPETTSPIGGTGTNNQNSDADLFVRQLQGRLLSALAGQVTDAIFGENPQDSGTVRFGDTTVTFERTLDSIRLTITNAADGTVTDIVVPQLVTSNAAGRGAGAASSAAAEASALQAPALSPLTIN
jgi:curli production assembly/transport component CsgF